MASSPFDGGGRKKMQQTYKELFQIVLVEGSRGLDSWTVPRGLATCGALKTRGYYGLDSWTVSKDWTHGPSHMDRPSWIGQAWSLKTKGLFPFGLVDRP